MLTKTDLIYKISETYGLKPNVAKSILNSILNDIETELVNGGKVKINCFGSFYLKSIKERKGINPLTKEPLTVKETRYPVFHSSITLKNKIKMDAVDKNKFLDEIKSQLLA